MSQLIEFDDLPLHQTSEPLMLPATSDRNFYDRNWFCGFEPAGSYYFGFTLGLYPNRGVIDAGFSLLGPDGVQRCLLASGRIQRGRLPLRVGPVLLDIDRPMRSLRVTIDENHTGISADLRFSTRTAALHEPRQVMRSGTRRTTDATRFNQYGRWGGVIDVDGNRTEVDEHSCYGVKDRSWGIRVLGAPETPGPVRPTRPRFLWSQVFWDDHVTHTLAFDDAEGTALVRDAASLPLYPDADAVPGIDDPREQRMQLGDQRVSYTKGTRWAERAEIDTIDANGTRTLTLEPVLRFQQRGIGYGHPRWPHGEWRGESVEREDLVLADLSPTEKPNVHVQHLVRASDGQRTGVGILEQFILGPYAPAGFGEI